MEIPLRRVAGSRDWVKEKRQGSNSGHYRINRQEKRYTDPDSNKLIPSSPIDWQILSRIVNSFSLYI